MNISSTSSLSLQHSHKCLSRKNNISNDNSNNNLVNQLDIADGLKELLIDKGLVSLESILNTSSSDLANTLGIDQYIAEIIRIATNKLTHRDDKDNKNKIVDINISTSYKAPKN